MGLSGSPENLHEEAVMNLETRQLDISSCVDAGLNLCTVWIFQVMKRKRSKEEQDGGSNGCDDAKDDEER